MATLRHGPTPGQETVVNQGMQVAGFFGQRRSGFLANTTLMAGKAAWEGTKGLIAHGMGGGIQGRGMRWLGRGIAIRQVIDAWDRLEQEGRMPRVEMPTTRAEMEEQAALANSTFGGVGQTGRMLWAATKEAAPEAMHYLAMPMYMRGFSGELLPKYRGSWGRAGEVLGRKAARLPPGSVKTSVGMKAAAFTGLSYVTNIGAGLIVATAANATGDIIKYGGQAWDGTGDLEHRAQAREMMRLDMIKRARKSLKGGQGLSAHAEAMIYDQANRIASRGGYQEFFGSSDSAFRRFFSWVPFSGVKNEEELRKEAMEELVKKQERIDQHKSKAWEFMRINAYDKAQYHFQETWNQSPEKGRVAAWKDPQRIYQIVQAARVTSRHYAASFQTRNRERTGD